MAINKVVFGTDTLVDLTGDSVTAASLLTGVTAHDKSGAEITGTLSRTTEEWVFTMENGSTVTKEVVVEG